MRQRTYILSSCTADAKVVTVICDYVTTFQDIFVRQSILTYAIFSYAYYTHFIVQVHGGPKNGLFLRSDNFVTTDDRKACKRCNVSKVSEFCLE